MATTAQVSLTDYLNTEYEPDCDYVDGALEERHVGKGRHSRTQFLLALWFGNREKEFGLQGRTEQRFQVSPTRVRIPDICLLPESNRDEVLQSPPILWVEILSPEDRWSRVQAKLDELIAFGVPAIWVIDPYANQAWIADKASVRAVQDGVLRCANPKLELALADILPED